MNDVREQMQEIGKAVSERIPKGFTFFVFVAPSDAVVKETDGRANYISNMHREDALNCMKEFLIKSGYEEDWMKHIK